MFLLSATATLCEIEQIKPDVINIDDGIRKNCLLLTELMSITAKIKMENNVQKMNAGAIIKESEIL
jgi:hypothetical protein